MGRERGPWTESDPLSQRRQKTCGGAQGKFCFSWMRTDFSPGNVPPVKPSLTRRRYALQTTTFLLTVSKRPAWIVRVNYPKGTNGDLYMLI
jgi:hypothetical protein